MWPAHARINTRTSGFSPRRPAQSSRRSAQNLQTLKIRNTKKENGSDRLTRSASFQALHKWIERLCDPEENFCEALTPSFEQVDDPIAAYTLLLTV